ncbi:hypothetical protein [Cryobacterium sp. PH29-G1]|uniref:hypothetical protein n=1 Tax=Cryobacterium sp. PH29-G1 TaxID=3046211 RepID=UPI0024BA1AC7|nr:hypothetical protein [Cryobacterium sp. PH29-G1]MDJ0350703.1 hypothetical protein [Cryobacterium sp. PH29-G1]
MKLLGTMFLAAIATTVILSGCSSAPGGGSNPTTSTNEATTSSAPSKTAGAAPSTTESSSDAEATSATLPTDPLDPVMVYALCKAQTISYVSKSYNATWAPFEEAITAVRDDGVIGIYIETIDKETANEMASVCQIGGTIGAPEWASYGVDSRISDRDFIVADLTSHAQA